MITTTKTIALVLAELKENYQGQFKITEHTAKVWTRRLEGIDAAAVLASVEEFCNSPSQFPPSAGQIRTRAIELSHGEMTTPSGADAWDRVCQWNRETPRGCHEASSAKSDVVMTDLEKAALKHIGGSWQLDHSRNYSFDRSAFISYYNDQIAKQFVHRSATPAAKQLVESRRPALPAAETKQLPAAEPEGEEPTEAELATLVGKLKEGMGR